MMNYRSLGPTNIQVSAIALGCVTFGREIDEEASFVLMDHALANGINLFDTAEAYAAGASERTVGRWLDQRGTRDQIVLATKVAGSQTPERILSSAEASLERLRTERIDLFQLHNWDSSVPLDETLQALDTLVKSGRVAHIGCSNYSAAQLGQALDLQEKNGWARMASVQPGYSLVDRQIEEVLLPLCAERQVGVLSYSPLAAGFLTGKYRRGGDIPSGTRFDIIPGHQDVYFSDENFRKVEALRELADRENRSMIHLALAWVFSRPGITAVLTGGRTPAHLDQALAAAAAPLPAELLKTLNNL